MSFHLYKKNILTIEPLLAVCTLATKMNVHENHLEYYDTQLLFYTISANIQDLAYSKQKNLAYPKCFDTFQCTYNKLKILRNFNC